MKENRERKGLPSMLPHYLQVPSLPTNKKGDTEEKLKTH
jgi:hypothetical protein